MFINLIKKKVIIVLIALTLFGLFIASTSASNEPSIDIQFPGFYAINISGESGNLMGVVGVLYTGRINITNFDKINDFENITVDLFFGHFGPYSPFNHSYYIYDRTKVSPRGRFSRSFNDTFNLSDCSNGYCEFYVSFNFVGRYLVSYTMHLPGNNSISQSYMIDIIDLIDNEKLVSQRALTEAQIKASAAAKDTANATKLLVDSQIEASKAAKDTATATNRLMWATFLLFLATVVIGIITYHSSKKSGEALKDIAEVAKQFARATEETAEATKELSKINVIESTPSITYDIVSGKNYFSKQIELEESEEKKKEYVHDTRFIINNHSRVGSQTYVNLNLKVNGESVEIGPLYSGKQVWLLQPYKGINGHFTLQQILQKTSITIEKMKEERKTKKDWKKQLTMDIEVKTKKPDNTWLENPTTHWSYDFEKDMWFSKDYNYHQ